MINEPETTPDNAHPHQGASLDDRLRAEEPPIAADDTSPSKGIRVHDRLVAEEPPVSLEDTAPSLATSALLSDEWPPRSEQSPVLQRLAAAIMLVGAAVITAIAVIIWMAAKDSDSPTTAPAPPDAALVAQEATATAIPPTSTRAAVTEEPAAAIAGPGALFPTAAADEIAAALLTPAPDEPPGESLLRESAPFTIRPATERTRVIQYTVQEGDTLDSIAQKFGLEDRNTLMWSNKSNKYNPLRPGVTLNILPEDGVYHEVTEPIRIADLAEKYNVDPYTIIDSEYNDLFGSTPNTILVKGMWVVVPGGEAELELFFEQPVFVSAGASGVLSGTYTLWGCTADIGGGSPPWARRPLDNYKWVRGFVPGGHTGVDLSANVGEPVYAAGAGTVVFAGWNRTGYGNVVVIAHGSTFSVYGHLSRVSVRCNQQVGIGDLIGLVGNTGNSSGPHLHFEIRDANWNAQNPLNYIGF